uniref:Uncharacterized protein n=1 Tax=Arundo donax TaxID=35708 RepID=A0A0A9HTB8_ARUDO
MIPSLLSYRSWKG